MDQKEAMEPMVPVPAEFITPKITPRSVVERVFSEVDPIKISTRSGIGEELYICAKVGGDVPHREELGMLLGAKIENPISVNLYALGNGLLNPKGKLSLIGYRSAVVLKDENGLSLYTDYKSGEFGLKPGSSMQYDFTSEEPLKGGNNAIQRIWYDGKSLRERIQVLMRKGSVDEAERLEAIVDNNQGSDPYAKGLGELMQAVLFQNILDSGITRVRPNILLSPGGQKVWNSLLLPGPESSDQLGNRKIDPEIVFPKIQQILVSHGLLTD